VSEGREREFARRELMFTRDRLKSLLERKIGNLTHDVKLLDEFAPDEPRLTIPVNSCGLLQGDVSAIETLVGKMDALYDVYRRSAGSEQE
jgi:hypothetical protein